MDVNGDRLIYKPAGWQSRPTPDINEGERERQGLVPIRSTHMHAHSNTHTHTLTGRRSLRSLSFHADLLSPSNVWYAGIQALLNDLISMGLPRHRPVCMRVSAHVCVCACVCAFICLRALPLDKTQDLARQTDTD